MAEDALNSRLVAVHENSAELWPPSDVTELDVSEMYRAHASFVAWVVRRAGVAERELHDVVQEVFLVVQRRLPEFEGRSHPRTWLYRIARNVASETRRRAYRRRELLEPADEPAAVTPDALEELQRCERDRALWAAVEELDPEKREALLHSELEERPLHELAARRGIPLKTAFSRLYAARRALQQTLRGQGWLIVPSWPELRNLARWLTPQSHVVLASVIVLGVLGASSAPGSTSQSAPVAPPLVAAVAQPPRPAEIVTVEVPGASVTAVLASPLPVRRAGLRSNVARRNAPPAAGAEVELPEPEPAVMSMRVVRTGAADLGLGPFGTSSLADPPFVAPERHPRAKLSVRSER